MKVQPKIKYVPLYILLAGFAAMLIAKPERYVPACFEGMALWAECVAPALFPFMVIALIMIRTGGAAAAAKPLRRICALLGLPQDGAAIFVMSAVSGYPAGSRIVYEYYTRGALTVDDAKKLAPMCSACGPLFAIGSLGQKMFLSAAAGAALFAAHLAAVAGTGAAMCLATKKSSARRRMVQPAADGGNMTGDAFASAVTSVILAGGFICFFYTLAAALNDAGVLAPLEIVLSLPFGDDAAAVCTGLVEATGGCAALAAGRSRLALPLAGALVTFGGASILAQQLCYLQKCGVKAAPFILFKAAQAALCFALLLPYSL